MKKRHLEILGYLVVQVRIRNIRLHVEVWYISYTENVICQSHSIVVCVFKQVPHFEWNSMELSTPNAWKEYLKKNLFGQLSS